MKPTKIFTAIFAGIATLLRSILRLLGHNIPEPVSRHHGIEIADVEAEARLAHQKEAAIDEINRQMTAPQIVFEYVKAASEDRYRMDLGALDIHQQDWLLQLSDVDLGLLAASGEASCARSLGARAMRPALRKLQKPEIAEEVLRIPSRERSHDDQMRDIVRSRMREMIVASRTSRYEHTPEPEIPTVH